MREASVSDQSPAGVKYDSGRGILHALNNTSLYILAIWIDAVECFNNLFIARSLGNER